VYAGARYPALAFDLLVNALTIAAMAKITAPISPKKMKATTARAAPRDLPAKRISSPARKRETG